MVPSWADQLLPQLSMEQFDTLPIQCRHIWHMHEGVWFRKNIFWQNDSYENLDIFSLIRLLYMHWWCLHGQINSYHSFWWSNLILSLYNEDTLNICMKEFIIFVCTDSTEIFSKLRSAGLNYNLPCFFHWLLLCGGYLISIAYWLFSFWNDHLPEDSSKKKILEEWLQIERVWKFKKSKKQGNILPYLLPGFK